MTLDIIITIIKQKTIINCFEKLQKIDQQLIKENIQINYSNTKYKINFMISLVVFIEVLLGIFNFAQFTENHSSLSFIWYMQTIFPILCNSIARIWFTGLILLMKDRFVAINQYFLNIEKLMTKHANKSKKDHSENEIFLNQEIKSNLNLKKNKISSGNMNGSNGTPVKNIHSNFFLDNKIDRKFIDICRIHDEICTIGKTVNTIYSFQMLVTMAYGFMNVTAQFYFLYLGLVNQVNIFLGNLALII